MKGLTKKRVLSVLLSVFVSVFLVSVIVFAASSMSGTKLGVSTSSPSTVLEVKGTASASYGLFSGGLQVGHTASVAYSRFGSSATSYAADGISASNDVVINGNLEVDSRTWFDSTVSVSGKFEVETAASHSFTGTLDVSGSAKIGGGTYIKKFINSSSTDLDPAGNILTHECADKNFGFGQSVASSSFVVGAPTNVHESLTWGAYPSAAANFAMLRLCNWADNTVNPAVGNWRIDAWRIK